MGDHPALCGIRTTIRLTLKWDSLGRFFNCFYRPSEAIVPRLSFLFLLSLRLHQTCYLAYLLCPVGVTNKDAVPGSNYNHLGNPHGTDR